MAAQSEHQAAGDHAIHVERDPPKSHLAALGIKFWPKWSCRPGRYLLKYEATETCYLLRGKVKVHYTSSTGTSECVEFGRGDLVVFPKGLTCSWEVIVDVDKHYSFDST